MLIPGLLPTLLLVQDSCYERWTVEELLLLCSLSLPVGELLEGRKDLRSPEAHQKRMHSYFSVNTDRVEITGHPPSWKNAELESVDSLLHRA